MIKESFTVCKNIIPFTRYLAIFRSLISLGVFTSLTMPPLSRKRRASDAAFVPSGSVRKKLKQDPPPPPPRTQHASTSQVKLDDEDPQSDSDLEAPIPNSSLPASPVFYNENEDTDIPPFNLNPSPKITSPIQTNFPKTPSRTHTRTLPETPLSVLQTSPVGRRGRVRVKRPHRNPLGDSELRIPAASWVDQGAGKQMAQSVAARLAESEQRKKQDHATKAQNIFRHITKPEDEGGFGFAEMKDFVEGLFGTGDSAQMKANISRWCRDHGADFATHIFEHSDSAFEDFLSRPIYTDRLRKEGEAIQKLLTRPAKMTMNELLESFSMQELSQDLHNAAPTLWGILTSVCSRESQSRRNKELVCYFTIFMHTYTYLSTGVHSNLRYVEFGTLAEGQ